MVTITISGFKNKEQAIKWLEVYEGSGEQYMCDAIDSKAVPVTVKMKPYISEMDSFEKDDKKENFNLILQ